MASRKLNALEQKIHKAVINAPDNTLSQKEIDAVAPDARERMASLNFLLASGLFRMLKDERGNISYRAVTKKELDAKKDVSGEEGMVLSHIQAAGNQGIWTKHIKAKTELHQTIIDRILKSLVQKKLIKSITNVQFPTRKMYMLYHLDPAVEVTGGPWYTDNELDTEFIKLLSRACLQFVKDRSFPRAKRSADSEHGSAPSQALYAISAAPAYPSSQQVQSFLSKSKITETTLSVEHVEMLLNVLVLDGEVERIPAFGAAMWDNSTPAEGSDEEKEDRGRAKKKRKTERKSSKKRKRKSHSTDESDPSDDEVSEEEDAKSKKKKRDKKRASSASSSKKSKSKARKKGSYDSDPSDSESDVGSKKSRKKKRKVDESEDESEDEDVTKSSKRKKNSKSKSSSSKKKKRHASPPTSDSGSSATMNSSGSESESDSDASSDGDNDDDDDDGARSSKSSRSKSRSKSKSSRHRRRRSPSPAYGAPFAAEDLGEAFGGAAYVYRAVRGASSDAGGGVPAFLGWSSEAPCAKCPVFEFCKEGGPVNPSGCVYYGEWLAKGVSQSLF